MHEDELALTAYHETGHIVANAIIGLYFQRCIIFPDGNHAVTYFCKNRPIILPKDMLSGTTEWNITKKDEDSAITHQEAIERTLLELDLEKKLIAYAAGLEASLIYATKRGWDTISIDTDAESPEDIKMMNKLIEVHKKQSERDQLITTAKERARNY